MNEFDELLKKIALATFLDKHRNITPGLIEYKIDTQGVVAAHTEGRAIELDFLTAIIIRDRIKKVAKDLGEKYIDTYFDLMKEIIPIIDKFEDKIIEPDKSDIDSIKKFNDLFKDLGL